MSRTPVSKETTAPGHGSSEQQGPKEPSFQSDKVYIMDGGFATHLTEVIGDGGKVISDPLWSSRALQSNPEAVVQTHVDFINAGANIIGTNTYQASAELFRKHLKFKDKLVNENGKLSK